MKKSLYTVIILAGWLAIGCPAFNTEVSGQEDLPLGREFSVSSGSRPVIANLADGGFVICWQTHTNDCLSGDVRCQRFGADGSKIDPEIQVNTCTIQRYPEPAVAPLLDGGFVVCWHSYQPDDNRTDVFAQRFAADGSKLGAEFKVNSYTPGFQQRCSVTSLLNGDFVVCWQSHDQDGWGDGPFAQRFAADGTKLGSEFQVHTFVEGDEELLHVASLSDSGFVISWHRFWAPSLHDARDDILIQRFDSKGNKLGTEVLVNVGNAAPFAKPVVTSLNDGSFVVCWTSLPYYYSDIRARHFAADGTILGPEFSISTYTPDVLNLEPSITTLYNGNFLVCWRHQPQAGGDGVSNCDIFARRFAADGTACGPEFRVNTYSRLGLLYNLPAVVPFADSGFVVCWQIEHAGAKAKYFPADSITIEEEDSVVVRPQGFSLQQNFPNPFNNSTRIRFLLPSTQEMFHVNVKIYNHIGQQVKVLVDKMCPPGQHWTVWDGLDAAGKPAASGVYFYQIKADRFTQTKRTLLLK